MTRLTQPLKWHGGKYYLAPWIIEYFPPHVHYVEPYFGGGAVLFAKPVEWIEGHSEVVNDIDGELMAFWVVLQKPEYFERFMRFIEAVPFSSEEFVFAARVRNATGYDFEKKAWKFFIRYRQSRQGLGKDFATLSKTRTRRGMNEQVSSWLGAIEGLPEAHERLKRVVILNEDALAVIKREDSPKTFFYLDPPYLPETRVTTGEYKHEMDVADHAQLLKVLLTIKGKFILSGYHSPMYDGTAKEYGWHCVDREVPCQASGAKSKPKRVESLWMNYEPLTGVPDVI